MPEKPVKDVIVGATAIITLCQMERLDLLKTLYGNVTVPKAVYDELCVDKDSLAAAELEKNREWIAVAEVKDAMSVALYKPLLHGSDAELMALAKETESPLLIIDDKTTKKHAKASGVKVTGTLGVIYRAKKEGHLQNVRKSTKKDVKPLISDMETRSIFVGKAAVYFRARPRRRGGAKKPKKVLSKRDRIFVHGLNAAIAVLVVFLSYQLVNEGIRRYDVWRNNQIIRDAQELMPDNWWEHIRAGAPLFYDTHGTIDLTQYLAAEGGFDGIVLGPPPELPSQREPIREILNLQAEFENYDIIGYIEIPNTRVVGAVVQAADNEYYLYRDLHGNRNVAGTLFLDYRNDPLLTDHNNIIYGHNMWDRSMFGDLRLFESPDFARENQYITVATRYEITTWRVFASYWYMWREFDAIRTNFETREEHEAFFTEVRRRSQGTDNWWNRGFFYFDYGVSPNDIILTLSTCSNVRNENRHIVHAVLVERR